MDARIHEAEQVGVVGNLRFALAFLVGDEVVDECEADVGLAVEQRRDEERRAGRIAELHADAVGLEEALALRRPQGQVPAAIEGDDAQGRRRRR